LSSANVTLPYEFATNASPSVPDSVRLSIRL
jgi:hypothetical protein